mmetsp:Transcript_35669/g.73294  ORF Transcript_35669/g.73294 Transcript_35669/m.73294 type:complete len:136 (+) Transcript_35669:289-696(+)
MPTQNSNSKKLKKQTCTLLVAAVMEARVKATTPSMDNSCSLRMEGMYSETKVDNEAPDIQAIIMRAKTTPWGGVSVRVSSEGVQLKTKAYMAPSKQEITTARRKRGLSIRRAEAASFQDCQTPSEDRESGASERP